MRVFIADASPTMHGRLTIMLSLLRGSVIVGRAYDAAEAANAIPRLKPDMVVLDLRLPGGGAFEVLRAVENVEPAPAVVVCADNAHPQDRNQCLEHGADFYLDKTTELEKMAQLTEGLLAEERVAA